MECDRHPSKKSQPTHLVGWASLPQESQRNLDVVEGNRVDQTGRLAGKFGIVSMDQDQRDTSLRLDDIKKRVYPFGLHLGICLLRYQIMVDVNEGKVRQRPIIKEIIHPLGLEYPPEIPAFVFAGLTRQQMRHLVRQFYDRHRKLLALKGGDRRIGSGNAAEIFTRISVVASENVLQAISQAGRCRLKSCFPSGDIGLRYAQELGQLDLIEAAASSQLSELKAIERISRFDLREVDLRKVNVKLVQMSVNIVLVDDSGGVAEGDLLDFRAFHHTFPIVNVISEYDTLIFIY